MRQPAENRAWYATEGQRSVLLRLTETEVIAEDFFLTGGTALAAFYFYHRTSNDLDLFTCEKRDLHELAWSISRIWGKQCAKLMESENHLRLLVEETLVDLVSDPLSTREARARWRFETGAMLMIDSVESIVANKLCAVASRVEPKDFIDLHVALSACPELTLEAAFAAAADKEAMFDDPPTAAFQIEENLAVVIAHPEIWPRLREPLTARELESFFRGLAQRLYHRI